MPGGDARRSSSKRKQEFKSGLGLERCPDPPCGQVFNEKSEDYWRRAPQKILCDTCNREAAFVRFYFAEDAMHRIHFVYWCSFCKEEFTLTIPMDGKYCGASKKMWRGGWIFNLRAPLPPEDPPTPSTSLNFPDDAAKEGTG